MSNLTTREQSTSNELQTSGNGQNAPTERFITPRATVTDTTDAVILELEMPGVPREAVSITVDRDELVVIGTRRPEEYANAEVLHQERPAHSFRRAFVLGDRIDTTRTSATHENGILRLTLHKAEDAKPRKIEIQ